MITKFQKEQLIQIAKSLPNDYMETSSNITISGEELLRTGHEKSVVNGKNIDPKESYVIRVPTHVKVNHAKRIVQAANLSGASGVVRYISKYVEQSKIGVMVDFVNIVFRKDAKKIFDLYEKSKG